MSKNLSEKLKRLLEPMVNAMGYELWGLEIMGQKAGILLRIYIDAETGITAEDCSRVSLQVRGILDVEKPLSREYFLEVSSPGLDRPLFTLEHYRRFIGSLVRLKLFVTEPGVKHNYLGKIEAVTHGKVTIISDGETLTFPYEQIEKARLVF